MDVKKMLQQAFSLGQTYWQQADSESYRQNAKAQETMDKFHALVESAHPAPAAASAGTVAQEGDACGCDMRTKLVGDGCYICNPQKYAEIMGQQTADMESELATLRAQLEEREADRAEQWRLRRDAEADRDTAKAVAAELREKLAASEARVEEITVLVGPALIVLRDMCRAAGLKLGQEKAEEMLAALSQPSQPAAHQEPRT